MPVAFGAHDAARLLQPSRPKSSRERRPHLRLRPLRLLPLSACCSSWCVRTLRPCIACHAVPNAPPMPSKQCERLWASSWPNACVCPCAVECRMDRQGSTATSMIGVVQAILRVTSAVPFPSDVAVVCAAGCLAGVPTLLRSQSLHVDRPKHTPALTVTHGVGSVSFCMRARA